jgi:hypothetical protein
MSRETKMLVRWQKKNSDMPIYGIFGRLFINDDVKLQVKWQRCISRALNINKAVG